MYAAAAVIYFTRVLGFSVARVGLALSAAGIVGFFVSVPFGRLVDAIGARTATAALQVAKAALMAVLAVATSYPVLLVIVVLLGAANRGTQIAWQALVADVAGQEDRVRVQALSRTAFNVGISIGVLVAAPVLAASSRGPFEVMLVGVAGCFIAVSQVLVRIPTLYRTPHEKTAGAPPVRRPGPSFVALGFVTGILALHISILEVALPLWVVQDTSVPRSTVSALLVVNTALVIALQFRLSKPAGSVRGATAVLTASGVLIALACLVFATTRGHGGWTTLVLLAAATALLTVGEVLQQAASWGLAFGLAPAGEQGRHLGAFSLGAALQDVAGPALVTLLVIQHAPGGWDVLAVVLLVSCAAVHPLSNLARRNSERGAATLPAPGPTESDESEESRVS
jgi:MFS family permease